MALQRNGLAEKLHRRWYAAILRFLAGVPACM